MNDQFGMLGLLSFIRGIEKDPSIVMLSLGQDLTSIGLNLNSSKKSRKLHQSFGGPWAQFPCLQDMDATVPSEYLTNGTIREKLPSVNLNKLSDDELFFLFYNCHGEAYQTAAALELYQRDWRYHKIDRVWLTRSPFATTPFKHTGSYEKSSYTVFDPILWRKVTKDMILEYKLLEARPNLPTNGSGTTNLLSNPSQPPTNLTQTSFANSNIYIKQPPLSSFNSM